jgi:death-on-curing protein
LCHIQNDDYYPTIVDKVTHLLHSIACFHCFSNGNKRGAVAASAEFLFLNRYILRTASFIEFMENYVVYVADNIIDKPLLHEIMDAYLRGEEDGEALKLTIYLAISREKPT